MDNKTNKQILMCDYRNIGHHWVYNYSVMENLSQENEIVYFTSNLDSDKKEALKKANISYIEEKFIESNNKMTKNFYILGWIYKAIKYSKKNNFQHIHFFTLDFIIIQLVILRLFSSKTIITATLHWLPNNNAKSLLLKKCIDKSLKMIVVHGNFIKKQLAKMLTEELKSKVFSIDYPSFTTNHVMDKAEAYNLLKLKDTDNKFILYFGEMRYDKGVDILLEALKHTNSAYKVIIAGKPAFFSKQYIENYAENNKKLILDINFIDDKSMEAYFTISDIIVLPYRKIFSGQSGPLTDGVKHNKLIIAPNIGQIGYTVETYKLGKSFNAENILSLAQTIEYCVNNYDDFMTEHKGNFDYYNKLTSVEEFLRKYRELFDTV